MTISQHHLLFNDKKVLKLLGKRQCIGHTVSLFEMTYLLGPRAKRGKCRIGN